MDIQLSSMIHRVYPLWHGNSTEYFGEIREDKNKNQSCLSQKEMIHLYPLALLYSEQVLPSLLLYCPFEGRDEARFVFLRMSTSTL